MSISQPGKDGVTMEKKGYVIMLKNITEFKELDSAKMCIRDSYHTIQSYVPHTNILSTTFVSEQDEFAVVDFMPCYELYDCLLYTSRCV